MPEAPWKGKMKNNSQSPLSANSLKTHIFRGESRRPGCRRRYTHSDSRITFSSSPAPTSTTSGLSRASCDCSISKEDAPSFATISRSSRRSYQKICPEMNWRADCCTWARFTGSVLRRPSRPFPPSTSPMSIPILKSSDSMGGASKKVAARSKNTIGTRIYRKNRARTASSIWSRTRRTPSMISSSLPEKEEGSSKGQCSFSAAPGNTGQRSAASLEQTVTTTS